MSKESEYLPQNKKEMLSWFTSPSHTQHLLDGFCRTHPSRYWAEPGVFKAKEQCVSAGLAEVMNRDWLPPGWYATTEVNLFQHGNSLADICIYRFENQETGLHKDVLRIEVKWASIRANGMDQTWLSMLLTERKKKNNTFDVFLGFFWFKPKEGTEKPAPDLFLKRGPLNGLTMPGVQEAPASDFTVIAPFSEQILALKRPFVLLGVSIESPR